MMKMKEIGYWTATAAVVGELVVGGIAGLLHGRAWLVGQPIDETMHHLGYAAYVVKITNWAAAGPEISPSGCLPTRIPMQISPAECWDLHQWLNQDKAQGSAATRFSVHEPAVVAQSPLPGEGAEGPL